FSSSHRSHRHLRAFPTRRSSDLDHGELFILAKDSTFRKGTGRCDHGAYSISKSHITLDYSCKDKASMLSEGVQQWGYTLKNGILALSPTFLNCDEGCSYHYKKTSNH